jgi:hypothetical protein
MIQLMGSESTSNEIILSETGFKKGSFEKIKISAEDVGNLQSIKIINKGRQQYRCNTIKIESQMNYWNFECTNPIKCPKCSSELMIANLITYEISVKTNSVNDSGTSMPVYISIVGTSGQSPKKLLSERGFETNSLVPVQVITRDIENIYAINLYLEGYDNWRPEEVIIKKTNVGGQCDERIFRNVNNLDINSPDKTLTLKLPKDSESDESGVISGVSSSLLDNKDQLSKIAFIK